MTCPDGKPHHYVITGYGEDMVGRCKKEGCDAEQRYACTMQDIAWKRWGWRVKRATGPVSAIGGTT